MSLGIIGLLSYVKPSSKCRRCGLRYRLKADQCPHCTDLDEAGLAELKMYIEQRHRANAEMGKVFLYLCGVLFAVLAVIYIVRH